MDNSTLARRPELRRGANSRLENARYKAITTEIYEKITRKQKFFGILGIFFLFFLITLMHC